MHTCNRCGDVQPDAVGRCPACGSWVDSSAVSDVVSIKRSDRRSAAIARAAAAAPVRHTRRRWLGMLGAALPLGFLAGCTGDADSGQPATDAPRTPANTGPAATKGPSATPTITPIPLPSATVDGIAFTITYAELSLSIDVGNGPRQAMAGKSWLTLFINAYNGSNTEVNLNSNGFRALVDGELVWQDNGMTEDLVNLIGLKDMGNFLGTDIEPGERIEFGHVYEIPGNPKDISLQIDLESTKRIPLNQVLFEPTATPEPGPTTAPAQPETIKVDGVTFTITDAYIGTNESLKLNLGYADAGEVWLVVHQTARNTTSSGINLNSDQFLAVIDGDEIREDDSATGFAESLLGLKSMGDWSGTDLAPSESVSFVHVYSVPKDPRDVRFQITILATATVNLARFVFDAETLARMPTDTPTPRPTATKTGPTATPQPAEVVKFGSLTLTISKVRLGTRSELDLDLGYDVDGMKWLVIHETAKNSSGSSINLDAGDFIAVVDGQDINEDDTATGTAAELLGLKSMGDWMGTSVEPYSAVAFVHVYQVPTNAKYFKFRMTVETASKTVDLGRFLFDEEALAAIPTQTKTPAPTRTPVPVSGDPARPAFMGTAVTRDNLEITVVSGVLRVASVSTGYAILQDQARLSETRDWKLELTVEIANRSSATVEIDVAKFALAPYICPESPCDQIMDEELPVSSTLAFTSVADGKSITGTLTCVSPDASDWWYADTYGLSYDSSFPAFWQLPNVCRFQGDTECFPLR